MADVDGGCWVLEVGLFRRGVVGSGRSLGSRLRDIRRCRLALRGDAGDDEALGLVDDFVWAVDPDGCWRKYWRLFWVSGGGGCARLVGEGRYNTSWW